MQRWVTYRWLTVATVGLGTSVLIAGVAWLTVTLARGELGTSDQLASVISAYIGICAFAVTVVGTVITARHNCRSAATEDGGDPVQHARPLLVSPVHIKADDGDAQTDEVSVVPVAPVVADSQGMVRLALVEKQDPEPPEQASRGRPVPRQLPAAPRLFIGRARELTQLTEVLGRRGDSSATVVISAIGGAGGIGKTALALHWAHQNIEQFPDGQLYVNLQGFDPSGSPMPPSVAVRGFLDALGVDAAAIPVDLDAQVALYRSLVAGKRILVVLDNSRDTTHVAALLPGSPTCTLLVTSRHQLIGLITGYGAQLLDLDVLPEIEARELLTRHLGSDKVTAEPAAVSQLLEWCAGLPLALRILVARAATHPDFPLSVLAEELREAPVRLDALDTGELNINLRALFSCSYKALDAEVCEVFILLGLAPGADISLPAVASLTALPISRSRVLLRKLEVAHLVQQYVPGRYRMHDLVRLYATERADHDHRRENIDTALQRLVDFYLHTAHAGEGILYSHRASIALDPPVAGCQPEQLNDEATALAWFDIEHPCLLATQQLAEQRGWHTPVWQLALSLTTFHFRRGHLHDHVTTWQAGVRATQQLADLAIQTLAHRHLGRAYSRVGRHSECLDHLRRALILAVRTGNVSNQARTHRALAAAFARQGDIHKALTHATQALRIFQTLKEPVGNARALSLVGWYHARLGEYEQARTYCDEAIAIFGHHLKDREGEASALDSLGYVTYCTGRHTEALKYYQRALVLFCELGNHYYAADTMVRLGEAHAALGQHVEAWDAWQQAVALYQAQHRTADTERIQQQLTDLAKHIS